MNVNVACTLEVTLFIVPACILFAFVTVWFDIAAGVAAKVGLFVATERATLNLVPAGLCTAGIA